jgi:hypothetical protein
MLQVAGDLFYWEGIRATGIDRMASQANVAYRGNVRPAMANSATRANRRAVVTASLGISIGCRLAGTEDEITDETSSI